jgi:hypothetical protein
MQLPITVISPIITKNAAFKLLERPRPSLDVKKLPIEITTILQIAPGHPIKRQPQTALFLQLSVITTLIPAILPEIILTALAITPITEIGVPEEDRRSDRREQPEERAHERAQRLDPGEELSGEPGDLPQEYSQ